MSDGSVKRIVREERSGGGRAEAEELRELERVLLGHAGVKEAVVLALERPQARRSRVAYVVGQEPMDGLIARLKEHLRSQPKFCAIPEEWVILESLPLTADGKCDRQALPEPEGAVYAQREYEEPQGVLERALAQIWSELLEVERVGRQDHFFELGGHSLVAVRLMERMRSQGLYADIRTLFMHPTLMGFAANTEKVKEVVL
jgi:aryl carrier-like protein